MPKHELAVFKTCCRTLCMSKSLNKSVMILGGPNTGTSSLVGMLNAHPSFLILYETDLNELSLGKYARRLLTAMPDLRNIMREHGRSDEAYRKLLKHAGKQGFDFTIAGDKLPLFNAAAFSRFKTFKLLYMYRKPAEWLAKAARSLHGEADVRPLLVEYFGGLLLAKSASDCMIVHFDDFLGDNANVVKRVFSFCGFDTPPQALRWWETVGHYSDPYRSSQKWWMAHGSSLVEPRRNDTRINRLGHPAWAVVDMAFAQAESIEQGSLDQAARIGMLETFTAALGTQPIPLASLMTFQTRRVSMKKRTLRGMLNSLLVRRDSAA